MAARTETYTIVLKARDEAIRVLKSIGPETVKASRAAARGLRSIVGGALRQLKSVSQSTISGIGAGLRKIGGFFKSSLLGPLLSLVAVFSGFQGLRSVTADAAGFQTAMAEVSTIVDTTVVSMASLEEGVLRLAAANGENEKVLAKGLYQAISAGVNAGADALVFLGEASRLAIAGVSDTASTVDLLTNFLNAYRLEVGDAARVSDVLFSTVKAGKTTIGELSSGLSVAIPLASALGVSVEELTASVAAITAGGGGSTSEASTQVAAVLRAMLKNFDDIDEAVRRVGSTFDDNSIRTRGFQAVIEDLVAATGGSESALIELLGRAEAMNAVLNLTGKNTAAFTAIIRQNEEAAGSVGEAYDKQMASPAKRLAVALNRLRIRFQEIGRAVLQAGVDAIETAGGLDKLEENLGTISAVLAELAGAGVRALGELLGKFDELIEKMGGAPKVTAILRQSFQVLFAGLDANVALARSSIRSLIEALTLVPDALNTVATKAANPFEAIIGREALQAQLDDAQAFLDELERKSTAAAELEAATAGISIGSPLPPSTSGLLERALAEAAALERARKKVAELSAEVAKAPASFDELEKSLARLRGPTIDVDVARTAKALGVEVEKLAELTRDVDFSGDPTPLSLDVRFELRDITEYSKLDEEKTKALREAREVLEAQEERAFLLEIDPSYFFDTREAQARWLKEAEAARIEAGRQLQADGFLLEIEGSLELSAEDGIDVERRLAVIRRKAIEDKAEELRLTEREIAAAHELLDIADRQAIGFQLDFGGFDTEIETQLEELAAAIGSAADRGGDLELSLQVQLREIDNWAEAEARRIDLLEKEGVLTSAQARRLRDIGAALADLRLDEALDFGGAGEEARRLADQLTLSVADQRREVDAWNDAQLDRLALLEAEGRLTKDQADNLRELLALVREQKGAQLDAADSTVTWAKALDTIGPVSRRNIEDALVTSLTDADRASQAFKEALRDISAEIVRLAVRGGLQDTLGGTKIGDFLGIGREKEAIGAGNRPPADLPPGLVFPDLDIAAQGIEAADALEAAGSSLALPLDHLKIGADSLEAAGLELGLSAGQVVTAAAEQGVAAQAALQAGGAAQTAAGAQAAAAGSQRAAAVETGIAGGAITTGAGALAAATPGLFAAAALLLKAAASLAVSTVKAVGSTIASTLTGAPVAFAKGGVVQGGLESIRSAATAAGLPFVTAARGGRFDGPHSALIGEGANSEAVVPLPDNRSIPVIFPGGLEVRSPAALEAAAFSLSLVADTLQRTQAPRLSSAQMAEALTGSLPGGRAAVPPVVGSQAAASGGAAPGSDGGDRRSTSSAGGSVVNHYTTENYYIEAVDAKSFRDRLVSEGKTLGEISVAEMTKRASGRRAIRGAARGKG